MKLNNGTKLNGITEAEFRNNLKDFQNGLDYQVKKGSELVFAYYEGITDEGKILLSVFPAGEFKGTQTITLDTDDYSADLLDELEAQRICLLEDDKIVFMSPNCEYSEMRIKGDFFIRPPREAVIAIAKAAPQKSYTLISRSCNGEKKVFAIRSARYASIDQQIIFDVINAIEDTCGTSVKWESHTIGNLVTEVIVSLPNVAKELATEYRLPINYTPCLMLVTSDTGDSSFIVYETWKHGNNFVFGGCLSRKHTGEFDEIEFAESVKENIFDKLRNFPEKLAEAALIEISPFGLSLTPSGAAIGCNVNAANWKKVIKNISKYIGLTKEVSKKTEMEITNMLIEEFDPTSFVSLYDAISEFLKLPERLIGIGEAKKRRLQRCVMKAAYYRPEPEATALAV